MVSNSQEYKEILDFYNAGVEKNLALYEKRGYKRFREEKINDGLRFVYLEKKDGV